MDTIEFLRRVLPSTGLYFIARFVEGKFRHQCCETIEEAAAYALQFDAQGVPTYHACAAFREEWVEVTNAKGENYRAHRTQSNVRAVRSFWLDLDVGEGKGYATQDAAVDGLIAFCEAAALALPMVASSGYGIHCYWTLTDEISPDTWKQTAEALKALCTHHGLKADPACTADPARVLRPVGTWNRKVPGDPRVVEVLHSGGSVVYSDWSACVQAALKAAGVKPPDPIRSRETADERLNAAFAIQRDFPPCSAHKVADRCQQFRQFRDKRGCIPEPFWYACLQLLVNTTEGEALAHEWSSGYPGYSPAETGRKLEQVRDMGPPLCATFESRNPGGCAGCAFLNKISSPAQLGAHVENAPAPVVTVTVDATPVTVEICNPPRPFTRSEDGIFMEEEGILHKIYEYDCYPVDIVHDESLGYEVVQWRHKTPRNGWKTCSLRTSLLAKPSDFQAALLDAGIQPLSPKRFVMYGDGYIRQLRSEAAIRQLFRSMGWKEDDTTFVLGDRAYRRDGTVLTAGHSAKTRGFLSSFTQRGELSAWRDLTAVLDAGDDVAPHKFMLLLGFAAPLIHIANVDGFTAAALGKTGGGKTTMGRWMASIYGHPDKTWLAGKTTENALIEHLSAYYSIPGYTDEITTIPAEQLRSLVYMVATGKGKAALLRDRTMRPTGEWKTILLASTNDSLQARLQSASRTAEAELMRLVEFDVPVNPGFTAFANEEIHPCINENYGVAGGPYIQYLVMHYDEIKAEIRGVISEIQAELRLDARERFWIWAAALAVYGGRLARKAGVIDCDPDALLPWLRLETQRMRQDIAESKPTAAQLLTQWLNAHIDERLVTSRMAKRNGMPDGILVTPKRGVLNQRYDTDKKLLWVEAEPLENHFSKCHVNHKDVRKELKEQGILFSHTDLKVLTAYTTLNLGGGQVRCWRIDMNHPEMRGVEETMGEEARV